MAVRYPKNCPTCPTKPALEAPTPSIIAVDPDTYNALQSERLWKHILVGTRTCVGMLEAYVEIGMPGNPKDGIRQLRDRLNLILETLASRDNETPDPT